MKGCRTDGASVYSTSIMSGDQIHSTFLSDTGTYACPIPCIAHEHLYKGMQTATEHWVLSRLLLILGFYQFLLIHYVPISNSSISMAFSLFPALPSCLLSSLSVYFKGYLSFVVSKANRIILHVLLFRYFCIDYISFLPQFLCKSAYSVLPSFNYQPC